MGKPYQAPKIQFKFPIADWLNILTIWVPFKRGKAGVQISETVTLSIFATREFTSKEDFDIQKQVPLVDLKL